MKTTYFKVDFVAVVVRTRGDAVCLECLAHFKVSQGRVCEGSNALGICRAHRNLWILNEISDVWDDVLWKHGDV